MKNSFHSFWRVIIWWKNKNVIKNSRHKALNLLQGLQLVVFGSSLPRCWGQSPCESFQYFSHKNSWNWHKMYCQKIKQLIKEQSDALSTKSTDHSPKISLFFAWLHRSKIKCYDELFIILTRSEVWQWSKSQIPTLNNEENPKFTGD